MAYVAATRPKTMRYSKARLAAIVWPFVAVVLLQAIVASLSIYTLSAVRGYVAGESMWSKGYKQAIHALEHYVATGDREDFRRFDTQIGIPLGDRRARLILESDDLDFSRARQGLLTGRNHPDDIPAMIWLFRNFSSVPYLAEAVEKWSKADPKLIELVELAHQIKRERMRTTEPHPSQIEGWIAAIDRIDTEVTPLTMAFAEALGRGSRAITYILFAVNFVSAALLILLAVLRTKSLLRQQNLSERALDAERGRAHVTLSSIGQAVITSDSEGRLDYMNKVAERLLGFMLDEATHARVEDLFSLASQTDAPSLAEILTLLWRDEPVPATAAPRILVRRDGGQIPISLVGAPLKIDGKIAGAVLVLNDMTRENEYINRLSHQASHDALTGLTNRRAFEERLGSLIGSLAHMPHRHSVMFVDLDQFKIVNDTCGHAAGDELLKLVARTLQSCLRDGDLLARLGGDEFGVILQDTLIEEAADVAERLRMSLHDLEFTWRTRSFSTSASIGLIEVTDATTSLEEALQAADVACYLAKEKGRNRVQIHVSGDAELERRIGEMAWVQRIRRAAEEDRFVLFAQEIAPLAEPTAGRHVELLVRLLDGNGGHVSPGSFLPAAERFGLMPLIDRWVVSHAFAEIGAHFADPEAPQIDLWSINLSGQTIGEPDFCEFVRSEFRRNGFPHDLVCFEITETCAIANFDTARTFIEAMKALGCSFSLDDFGAGMSSFGYLKQLPVDYLKIDGSFVKDIVEDATDRAMVEAIHRIGHVTGKKTVAEFVETEEILAALREMGIDYAQGYAVAKPRPLAELRRERSPARNVGRAYALA